MSTVMHWLAILNLPVVHLNWSHAGVLLLTAAAIRLLDDALDRGLDDGPSLLKARQVYAPALLVIASTLDPTLVVGLFGGSYLVGMIREPYTGSPWLPWGLDTVLAAAIVIYLSGPRLAVWAALLFAAIQCWDDLLDRKRDQQQGLAGNLALRFDPVEVILAAITAAAAALFMAPLVTVTGFALALVFSPPALHWVARWGS